VQHRVLLVIALGGCARGSLVQSDPDASNSPIDAPAGTPVDAPGQMVDAPSGGALAPLLLTEVVLQLSVGEFVEIANPNAQPVDLSTYYLSDAGNYFRIPGGPPVVDPADFIARFPAGSSIPGKGVITVALDTTAAFTATYGAAPTFALSGGTMTVVASNGVPGLTNTGELVALFRWDGTSDLVKDVDIVLAGVPTAGNGLVDKSGVTLDGPDADVTSTAYKTDARTLTAQPTAPASGKSTKRTALEAGHETQSGAGNGLTGDDETSENTAMTWDTTFTNPTPGTIPTGLLP
jgi:hypothetical protein